MAFLGAEQNVAPFYIVEVANVILDIGITQFITDISYESADGLADVCKVKVMNPDFKISDARVFQPGNELAVWMGYGSSYIFIGRVIIDKVRANFPAGNGMPAILVTGYTKDVQMKENAPPVIKQKKGRKKKGKGGRSFPDALFSDAVEARFANYSFKAIVDVTPGKPRAILQKAGMNDFEFIQGMANITGFLFWVEGDEAGNWLAYFLDPEGVEIASLQNKKYNFAYNTKLATLQSFDAEQIFAGASTKLVYEVTNPKTGKVERVEIDAEDKKYDTQVAGEPVEEVGPGGSYGNEIKLFIGDYSIEVASGHTFKTPADFEIWAVQWFRRNQENFIMARGLVVGVENLRARQTHTISGVGSAYSGDYYFTRVKHVMSSTGGYMTDFSCRRIID